MVSGPSWPSQTIACSCGPASSSSALDESGSRSGRDRPSPRSSSLRCSTSRIFAIEDYLLKGYSRIKDGFREEVSGPIARQPQPPLLPGQKRWAQAEIGHPTQGEGGPVVGDELRGDEVHGDPGPRPQHHRPEREQLAQVAQ